MRRWFTPALIHFQNNEPEPEPPKDIEPFTFFSPSRGDAHDFSVTLRRTASSARKRVRAVLDDEMSESNAVLQRAYEEVRQVTRRFGITDAGAAELATNERLAEISGSLVGIYRWRVRAEVNVSDEVRKLNQDAYKAQHAIRSGAEAKLLHIKTTDEVRKKWQDFLTVLDGDTLVEQAIKLTHDPTQLPQIVTDLVERREQGARELLTIIDKIMQRYEAVDMLDLEVSSESVLRRTLELLGVPVPPLDDDTVLAGGG